MMNQKNSSRSSIDCQLSTVQDLESRPAKLETKNMIKYFKACLAEPWNHYVKPWIKSRYRKQEKALHGKESNQNQAQSEKPIEQNNQRIPEFQAGELLRVRSRAEIESTLDNFNELKGCAFLDPMFDYCGTEQKVYVKVERFLDERSYKVRSSKGLYFLENLQCTGTAVFGRCDRRCYYFWRAEWLEKIDAPDP